MDNLADLKEKLESLEKRFDCAYGRTKKLGLYPDPTYWNIKSSSKYFAILNFNKGCLTNPFSLFLIGKKIDCGIFGNLNNDKSYNNYLVGENPFYQMGKMLFGYTSNTAYAFSRALYNGTNGFYVKQTTDFKQTTYDFGLMLRKKYYYK